LSRRRGSWLRCGLVKRTGSGWEGGQVHRFL
jgi:hypothetical protein